MVTFHQPLWLFLFIPLLWVWCFSSLHRKKGFRGLMWSFKIWQHETPYFGSWWAIFCVCLSRIAFFLMIIGLVLVLAQPHQIYKIRSYLTDGNAIMMILDTSPSMAVRDLGMDSRFELAKSAIFRFIASRENDMIGLISFGKEAAIRSPLTRDYNYFQNIVSHTKILEHGDGTSIGTALALAGLHLKESQAKQNSIVIITDGDNNSGEIHPDVAINILRNLGIRVYVVGLGRSGSNNVTVVNPYTKEILQGTVHNAYNEELLSKIATHTGGQFFRTETLVAFESLFQVIDLRNVGKRQFMLIPKIKKYNDFLFFLVLLSFYFHFLVRFLLLREAL